MRKVDNVPRSFPGHPPNPHKHISCTLSTPSSLFLSPRKLNPLLSPPFISKWRYHLHPNLPTSYKFFHLTQLFSRDQGGYVLSLGLVKPNKIKISTIEFDEGEGGKKGCEGNVMECQAERYWGRTVQHRMLVRWGKGGMIDCRLEFVFYPFRNSADR